MMDWLTIKDVGLFAVALYGAALSTYNLIVALRKERRSLSVVASSAIPVGLPFDNAVALITATNRGTRPVTLTRLSFELPDRRHMASLGNTVPMMPNSVLPKVLSDGEAATYHIFYREIAQSLRAVGLSGKVKLTPVAVDSIGGRHIGKAWTVDIAEFLRM